MDDVQTLPTETVTPGTVRPTKADDLLEMYDQEEAVKVQEIDSEVSKQVKIAEEVPKRLIANKIAKSVGDAATETEEPAQEESLEEELEETTEADEPVVEKVIKAKLGDKEVDLPEEAVIQHKIGHKKYIDFKVSDAIEAYIEKDNNNRTFERRNFEISNKEKAYEGKLNSLKEKMAAVSREAATGNIRNVISTLAKMAAGSTGIDPAEIERATLDNIKKTAEAWSKMTPDQQEAYLAKRKAAIAEEEIKTYKTKAEREAATNQLHVEVQQACGEVGISQDEFYNLYGILVQNEIGEGRRFSAAEEITTKDVVRFHLDIQHMGLVNEAIDLVNPELANIEGFKQEAFARTLGEGLDVNDIAEVIRQAEIVLRNTPKSSQSVENLNRKVNKAQISGNRTQSGKVSSSEGKQSSEDAELDDFFFSSAKKRQASISALVRR